MDTKCLLIAILSIISFVSANSCQLDLQSVLKNQDTVLKKNQDDLLQNQAAMLDKINKISISAVYWDQVNEKLRMKIETLESRVTKLSQEVENQRDETEQDRLKFEQRMTELESEVNIRRNQGGGSVFVRWGRKDCPANTSHIVYTGLVGGSRYDVKGGGSNFLCLPKLPQQLSNLPSRNAAFLYGGEYDSSDFGPVNGDDVPCAVCRSTLGIQTVMIPARVNCYNGWTKQYKGFLSASHKSHFRAEYICMDEKSQAIYGGRKNDNGAIIYPVSYKCGPLPCPPYKDEDTASCVVCSL